MKVAIIGAGNVGKALATSITRAGHDVTLTGKNRERAAETAREIGASTADGNAAAVADADLVILAVPFVGAADEVTDDIRDGVAGNHADTRHRCPSGCIGCVVRPTNSAR